jgi:hypothetical protein
VPVCRQSSCGAYPGAYLERAGLIARFEKVEREEPAVGVVIEGDDLLGAARVWHERASEALIRWAR